MKKNIRFALVPSDPATKIEWNSTWMQNGITVAGGNKEGEALNQLYYPYGIYVDDNDQSIYVSDEYNHRIVQWKPNAINGQVVAGGNGSGNETNQLSYPTGVILNKRNNSLIISDLGNRRIVEWSRQNPSHVEILLSNVEGRGLAMDKDGSIYISSYDTQTVERWKTGDKHPVIVAGGNGEGNHSNQLRNPRSIFVDDDYSLYIPDVGNHRVMKWLVGAKEGLVVAGGNGHGDGRNQLAYPHGIVVDQFGRIYVADTGNDRVVRWNQDGKEGVVIVGGNGRGNQTNQLDCPVALTFDQHGNLYVDEYNNGRIQKFLIQSNS